MLVIARGAVLGAAILLLASLTGTRPAHAQELSRAGLARFASLAGQQAIQRFAVLNDRQVETPDLRDDPEWQRAVTKEFTQLLNVALVLHRDDVDALLYEEAYAYATGLLVQDDELMERGRVGVLKLYDLFVEIEERAKAGDSLITEPVAT